MDLAILAALNITQELLELQKEKGFNDQLREEKIGQLIEVLEHEMQAVDR